MLKDKDYIGRRIFSAAFNVLHKNKLINSCEIHVQALVILTEKCYNDNGVIDMKKCSEALQNLLMEYMQGKRTTWYIAELYTFWLKMDLSYNSGYFNSGTILLRTGHDVDLTVGGNKYIHMPISHDDINEKLGVETADTEMNINYNPNDKIDELGVTWIEALQGGTFDGGGC